MAPFKDLRFLLTGLSTLDSATLKRQVIGLFTLSKWWCESFQHLTPFDLFKRIQLTNLSQLLKGNLSSKKMDPVSFTSLSHYSKSPHFVQKSTFLVACPSKNVDFWHKKTPKIFFTEFQSFCQSLIFGQNLDFLQNSKFLSKSNFRPKIGLFTQCNFNR